MSVYLKLLLRVFSGMKISRKEYSVNSSVVPLKNLVMQGVVDLGANY